MAAPRLTFLPDLLEIHFGEVQSLWGRRRAALRSPDHNLRTLAALDERIEAHTQGLLVVGGPVRALVEPALAGDEPDAAFAAAYALLRLGNPDAARAVVRAVPRAESAARRGLTDALAHAPAEAVEPYYAALAAEGEPGAMAVATEVLAFRGVLRAEQAMGALDVLFEHDDSGVRTAGWRAAGYLGARVTPGRYAAGWRDDDPAVRRAALEAAAWARDPDLVAFGGECAARPTPESLDALYLLAVLAEPEDVPRLAALASAPGAPPAHLALLGPLGSPAYADHVVRATAHPHPAVAAAAGAAFLKLTGEDVFTGRTAFAAAPDADPFDAEFADLVRLPDPERAAALWEELRPRLAGAVRLCRGVDVGGPLDSQAAGRLDLESRWEYALRARYAGEWEGSPADLEVSPIARPRSD